MYFTSGQNRAFERLMQEKPGFDHYDGGGADAPEDWDYTLKGLSLINRESIPLFPTPRERGKNQPRIFGSSRNGCSIRP